MSSDTMHPTARATARMSLAVTVAPRVRTTVPWYFRLMPHAMRDDREAAIRYDAALGQGRN